MPIYPSSGGFIGSLLRTIQEERSKAPHVLPPASEPQAPIRAAVQAPLESPISPESPGSSRVISVRPEGSPPTAASTPPGRVTPPRTYIGGEFGGVSPWMREKHPEAFNGSEASAVQNQQQTSSQPQQPVSQPQAAAQPQGRAASTQPVSLADIMREHERIMAPLNARQAKIDATPPNIDALKNRLIATAGVQGRTPEQEKRLSQSNYQAPPKPDLFQRLSSGIQNKAKSATSKIKGLFQRLF